MSTQAKVNTGMARSPLSLPPSSRRSAAMRLVVLTLVLCCPLGWSFQIGSPAFTRRGRSVTNPTSSGNTKNVCEALRSTSPWPNRTNTRISSRGLCGADEVASEPLLALKDVLAGLVAAAFVLAADPGTALADTAMPAASGLPSGSVVEATATSTTSAEVQEVVPTIKLEGELAAQFKKAQAAGSVQQFDKAKKLYNQVVKYAPGYVYGWSNRANVLIAEGDLKAAVSDYDRALQLAEGIYMPDKWIIYLNRGTTLMALGDDDRAMSDLNQAAKLNTSKDLYTLANRAQAFERRGDWAKALADYEGAINVQPGNVQPWWIRYSLVLFQEGRDFDSLAFLKRVQAKFEGVGEVQAAMTAIEFGRGDMKAAEGAWRGINIVDQQMYLKDSYLKDQLKWPPRVVESLKSFDRERKEADTRPAEKTLATTAAAATTTATTATS
ncbi:TPR domain-containing protein [Ectocarpus siliculosus]|uniref:TPR domain-containing protein n=1 Tax=Ectocarpus siliculosus TaxID=2880 RepID=D7FQV0_ECTSI|nr:TPR domain-containing protein [Ectocarpus siliculosus]|eukprot:CBJ30660.1 TPR domain-containing protein [Ectocarpus siliculosus]